MHLNKKYIVYEVPKPNAWRYTTARTNASLAETLERSTRIGYEHELIRQWSVPASVRVHVHRDGAIRTTDSFKNELFGLPAVQKSIDGVIRIGNPVSVLLTSDTDGWGDLKQKQDVLKVLTKPHIVIYMVGT